MADGDLEAVFKGLAQDAGQAGKDIGESIAKFTESTADNEDANVARTLEADAQIAKNAEAAGREASPASSAGGDVPGVGVSNRERPPVEGDREYQVYDPADPGRTITDIDRVGSDRLWEEKTATGQNPNINLAGWTQKHIIDKLDSYLEARPELGSYQNAPIGFDFTQPGATPQFKAAVEAAVQQWEAAHPGIPVTVRWAS